MWLNRILCIWWIYELPIHNEIFDCVCPLLLYEYDACSITNGWHKSHIVGLVNVFCRRNPGLDELMLGASERHLSSQCCSGAKSLSSIELAAALGEMLGVRPAVRNCDISEPRRLRIFLKPGPEQKHLHIICLNANRKSFENNGYTAGLIRELQ